MVGSVSLDGGSVCGRTVDPSHPQLLSPEGTGDMPVGQPPTCPHTEEPVPRRRTLGRGISRAGLTVCEAHRPGPRWRA